MHCLYNHSFCYENDKKKKIYPQVYLGECKFKSKKTKMYKFINTELKLESESEPDDTRLKSDSQLESDSK